MSLIVYGYLTLKRRVAGAWLMLLGVTLTIVASVIQATKVLRWGGPVPVNSDGVFHLVQIVAILVLSPFCELCLVRVQAFDFARDDKFFILAEHNAAFGGELLRALSDEVDMRAFAQDLARSAHGIAQVLDASHAPGAKRGAIHYQGVELHAPVAIEEAAASGVESLVVFHDDDRLFDGVEGGAAALEHPPSRGDGIIDAPDVGINHVIRHGPRTAMND